MSRPFCSSCPGKAEPVGRSSERRCGGAGLGCPREPRVEVLAECSRRLVAAGDLRCSAGQVLQACPRVVGRRVAEVSDVARCDLGAMPDSHGIDEAVPEGLGLAFRGAAVGKTRTCPRCVRVPVQHKAEAFFHEGIQSGIDLQGSRLARGRLRTFLDFRNDDHGHHPFGGGEPVNNSR